jgi:hypothetical protein
MDIAAEFMAATINAFEANKRLADRAVEQVPDDKLHTALDANTNSIAVIMKHVAGNLISRWTDFLTTDLLTYPPESGRFLGVSCRLRSENHERFLGTIPPCETSIML